MLTLIYERDGAATFSHDASELPALLEQNARAFWLDLEEPTEQEFDVLASTFHFHPLAVEDAMRPNQRPKVDEYEGYCFIVANEMFLNTDALKNKDAGSAKSEQAEAFDSRQISIFLSETYLVTVHLRPLEGIQQLRPLCKQNKRLLEKGVGYILYTLLDIIVDGYFPLLDSLEDTIDAIEDRIIENPSDDTLDTIFTLKRELQRLRRYIAPLRNVMQTLTTRAFPGIMDNLLPYLRDVDDHLFRIYETLDSYRDLMSNLLDAYLSQVNNRMNRIMQRLAAVSTVFLPLTFVTGLFGMNFDKQPWAHTNAWVWIVAMTAVAIGITLWFRRRHMV